MKISELIQKLEKVESEYGDLEIILTGCYGSTDDLRDVKIYATDIGPYIRCIIETSLMTG